MNPNRRSVLVGAGVSLLLASLWIALSVIPATATEQVYYFHNDHLGTPQAMSNASGRKVWEAEYEPFGKAAVNQDPDGNGQIVINNLRFPGQYFDAETGLHYNYYRDYDPATGRYLQPDPIGLAGGLNPYSYVANNPVNFVDPFGLWVEGAGWWSNMGNRLDVMRRAIRYGEWDALGKEFEGQFRQIAEMDPVDFALAFSGEELSVRTLSKSQLSKLLNVCEKDLHPIKKEILRDAGKEVMKKVGKNPNIAITKEGEIVLESQNQEGVSEITKLLLQ